MAAKAAACSAFLACIVISAPMYVQRGQDELFRPLHILGRSRMCVISSLHHLQLGVPGHRCCWAWPPALW